MAAITPRRSTRLPHTHTPKMSERKKSLFQSELVASRESLTRHRRLPVVNSESDSDDCDLGIISTLDSSSGDEVDHAMPKTPERGNWHGTRSSKLLKENNDLKNFIKSPFTLNKYQTRYSCPEKNGGSLSTPVTPHMRNHPGTPSSTHSCTSVHTTSSSSSKARKSLASLIADTESCSSSLKDLNFDTDSGTDTKENTPTKSVRRSGRNKKLTPKFQSFKGILMEQTKNVTPPPLKNAVVCLTKIDMTSVLSPTQMLKTPNTSEANISSPPKLGHNRRSVVEVAESPDSCDSEKSHKRLRNNSLTEYGPVSKYPKLDANSAPKARLSLFNSDKLKEILSAKSFYGKSNPELNTSVTAKLSNAIEATNTQHRRLFTHAHSHRRKRKSGQINLGVRHRIRKPKVFKNKFFAKGNQYLNMSDPAIINNSTVSNISVNNFSMNNVSMLSQNSSQELEKEKADPFDKEKQTIEALLSQWTEEEIPESEQYKPELPCFNSTVIEETNQIFQPVTAIPVSGQNLPQDEAVIVELGTEVAPKTCGKMPVAGSAPDVMMAELHKASHGEVPNGPFLPVDGGFILVQDNMPVQPQEELTDLDEIERELKMLDEQILLMTHVDGAAPLPAAGDTAPEADTAEDPAAKLFPIFSKPNPGTGTSIPSSKASKSSKKSILKDASDQYVIDAGQKKFGATQCTECGVIYQIGDPQDEHDHLVHHNATDVLKFNGWKEETVVGRWDGARCLRVRGGDPNWRRVHTLLTRVVHVQLGYNADLPGDLHTYTAYLYVEKKQIVGCCVAQPRTRAARLVAGARLAPGAPDCCSLDEYPVKCGISRIWTHAGARRRGVATRLLDCARASFLYGAALRPSDLAFSAPTPQGKALATNYCGTDQFYVYLD